MRPFSGRVRSADKPMRSVAPSGSPSPDLPAQGDRCIMGQQRSFRKRKPSSWCIKGRAFTSALASRVCACRASDFLW